MFTRDRLPNYFIQGEPSFHLMAPNLSLGSGQRETGRSFFDEDPRLDPHYWVRDWYVLDDGGDWPTVQPENTKNYFLLDPAPIGFAVNMWFNLQEQNDLRYLWYWRALVWHDLTKMVEGEWWVAARWLKPGKANTYKLLFEKENDSVLAGAYIAGLDCSRRNLGK